jgi:hypothetical protein
MVKFDKVQIGSLVTDIKKFSAVMNCKLQGYRDDMYKKKCVELGKEIRYYESQINFNDATATRLLSTKWASTRASVMQDMNEYKGVCLTKNAYFKSEERLTLEYFQNMKRMLVEYNYSYMNHKSFVIIVDGSHTASHMYTHNIANLAEKASIEQKAKDTKRKAKTTKENGNSITKEKNNNTKQMSTFMDHLLVVAYEPTIRCPIALYLGENMNEKTNFLNWLKKESQYKDALFIFDRNYFSHEFLLQAHEIGFRYIMRVDDDNNFVSHKQRSYDKIITLHNDKTSIKTRILGYYIDDNRYHILTNLNREEFSLEMIQELYKQRWSGEEYIKLAKYNTKTTTCSLYNHVNYLKTMEGNLIMTLMESIIENMIKRHLGRKWRVINRTQLFVGIYKSLLLDILYCNINDEVITTFCGNFVEYLQERLYRKFDRVCMNWNFKWFDKQHQSALKKKTKEEKKIKSEKKYIEKQQKYEDPTVYKQDEFIVKFGNGRALCKPVKIQSPLTAIRNIDNVG